MELQKFMQLTLDLCSVLHMFYYVSNQLTHKPNNQILIIFSHVVIFSYRGYAYEKHKTEVQYNLSLWHVSFKVELRVLYIFYKML